MSPATKKVTKMPNRAARRQAKREPAPEAPPPFNIREVVITPTLEFRDDNGKLKQRGRPEQPIVIYEADETFPLVMQILRAKGLTPVEDKDTDD